MRPGPEGPGAAHRPVRLKPEPPCITAEGAPDAGSELATEILRCTEPGHIGVEGLRLAQHLEQILRQEPIRTFFEIDTPATGHWASLILVPVLLFVALPLFAYAATFVVFAPFFALANLIERISERRPKR